MADLYDPLERAPRDAGEIEVALIEWAQLWRRSPGGGRWPFAGDGPWHLVQAEAGDYDARGGDMADAPMPRVPLSTREVRRRDHVEAWWPLIPAADRALVGDVVGQLAAGRSRPDWGRLIRKHRARNGGPIGVDGLAMRHWRALLALAGAVRVRFWSDGGGFSEAPRAEQRRNAR